MTNEHCKHQCQRAALAARPAGRRALFAVLGAALLTLAQPIEAWCQKSRPANRAPRPNASPAPSKDWLQWGGPRRDFVTPSTGLPSLWPADGPRKLWSRTLGDGYSGIAVEGTTLYTAYRRGSQDVVTALDARSGKTVWEYAYEAPFTNSYSEGVGPGPYAM